MSATKSLQKALPGSTPEQRTKCRAELVAMLATERNMAKRSSLSERIRIIDGYESRLARSSA